jgi:hypothetical protein
MSEQKFKLGDKVTWQSQSGGWVATKTGEIVAVIKAGNRPDSKKFPDLWNPSSPPGWSRDDESYVIRVQKGPKSFKHYWPRVKNLRVAE